MDIPEDKKADINSILLQIPTSGSFASASLASDLVYLLSGDYVQCPDCDGTGTVPNSKNTDSRSTMSIYLSGSPPCPRCCGKGFIPKPKQERGTPTAP